MTARTSLVIQWLRLCACIAGGTGSIPGQGTKIVYIVQCSKTNKQTNKQTMTAIVGKTHLNFRHVNMWEKNASYEQGTQLCSFPCV